MSGPWAIHPILSGSENHKGYRVREADGNWICDVSPRDEDGIEGLQLALLIAAAPELLEALEAVFDLDDEDHRENAREIYRKARAAIARAKGETT